MTTRATGSFDVQLTPEASQDGPGSALGRLAIAKQFQGDLVGTSTGAMLSAVITVVPDSGTDGLAGIAGRMRIVIEGKQHSYEFDYALP